jgi:hypothetical protein
MSGGRRGRRYEHYRSSGSSNSSGSDRSDRSGTSRSVSSTDNSSDESSRSRRLRRRSKRRPRSLSQSRSRSRSLSASRSASRSRGNRSKASVVPAVGHNSTGGGSAPFASPPLPSSSKLLMRVDAADSPQAPRVAAGSGGGGSGGGGSGGGPLAMPPAALAVLEEAQAQVKALEEDRANTGYQLHSIGVERCGLHCEDLAHPAHGPGGLEPP